MRKLSFLVGLMLTTVALSATAGEVRSLRVWAGP